jgi:hypothetical protein
VQLGFTGSVSLTGAILNASATLASEGVNSALFNIAFDYDSDPNQAGVQSVHATGTLGIEGQRYLEHLA